MEHTSIWRRTTALPERAALEGSRNADAVVIGAGLAGVLIARRLQAQGLETVVLEAAETGSGQTGNTTAKITSQHGLIYNRLLSQWGEELARQYAQANQQAVAEYRLLCADADCDWEDCPAFLYATGPGNALELECAAAQKLGIDASLTAKTELPFPVTAALRFDGQARFHPLRFLEAAAAGLTIYEHTRVLSVEGMRVVTPRGTVTARYVVFACHFPFVNVPGYYFMRMHQERSYVLALEGAQRMEGMYLGIDRRRLSFRAQGELLLLGGEGRRTGEHTAGGRYRALWEQARKLYPRCSQTASWSAQDCMTLDGVPYIGRFSVSQPQWYVATGFRKWGMTSAMVSAMVISDLIVRGESPWAEVFSPQRFDPGLTARTLYKEAGYSVAGLSRGVFAPPRGLAENLPEGHGGVVEWDGEKAGVYKEEGGETHVVSVRCPHMGCQLEWDPDEKRWECPCHGSRFDCRGKLLDGPAQTDLEGEEGSDRD